MCEEIHWRNCWHQRCLPNWYCQTCAANFWNQAELQAGVSAVCSIALWGVGASYRLTQGSISYLAFEIPIVAPTQHVKLYCQNPPNQPHQSTDHMAQACLQRHRRQRVCAIPDAGTGWGVSRAHLQSAARLSNHAGCENSNVLIFLYLGCAPISLINYLIRKLDVGY